MTICSQKHGQSLRRRKVSHGYRVSARYIRVTLTVDTEGEKKEVITVDTVSRKELSEWRGVRLEPSKRRSFEKACRRLARDAVAVLS